MPAVVQTPRLCLRRRHPGDPGRIAPSVGTAPAALAPVWIYVKERGAWAAAS